MKRLVVMIVLVFAGLFLVAALIGALAFNPSKGYNRVTESNGRTPAWNLGTKIGTIIEHEPHTIWDQDPDGLTGLPLTHAIQFNCASAWSEYGHGFNQNQFIQGCEGVLNGTV